jgi:hypothetical protein
MAFLLLHQRLKQATTAQLTNASLSSLAALPNSANAEAVKKMKYPTDSKLQTRKEI